MKLEQEEFINTLGNQNIRPETCNLKGFFDKMRASAMLPVILPTEDLMEAPIMMIPSSKQALVDACLITVKFESLYTVSEEQPSVCFNTPEAFVTGQCPLFLCSSVFDL